MCVYCTMLQSRTISLLLADHGGDQPCALASLSGVDVTQSALNASLSQPAGSNDLSGASDTVDGRADFGSALNVRSVSPTSAIGTTGNFTNADVNGLLAGTAWNTRTITYSFPTSSTYYGTSSTYSDPAPFNGFQVLSAAQMAVVQTAFRLVSQYTAWYFSRSRRRQRPMR